METYTLIAYKPSSSTHEGCHCHGNTLHFDSAFEMERGLTFEQLAHQIATFRTSKSEGAPYEFKYFDDTAGPNWEEEQGWGFDDRLEALIAQQQPIIAQKQAQEAAAKAAREAAAEKLRREKYAAEEKERRDREEYQRLSKKFAPEVKP